MNDEKRKEFDLYKATLRGFFCTKGARFDAHTRLLKKQQASNFTISLLTLYVIAASITLLVLPNPNQHILLSKTLSVATIVVSVFILMLTHIESDKKYLLRADNMLRCAQKVTEIYRELQLVLNKEEITPDIFRKITEEYNQTIRDFSDHHSNVDLLYFMANHKKKFNLTGVKCSHKVFWYKFLYHFNIYGGYFFLCILPPILVVSILLYINYLR